MGGHGLDQSGLRIGTGGELLWMRWWTFGFHKMRGISWVAQDVLASQEWLCSMEWYEIMWKTYGTAEKATDQDTIRCMRFACLTTKITHTHSECTTYSFSRRLSVTSYVHCLSCFVLSYTLAVTRLYNRGTPMWLGDNVGKQVRFTTVTINMSGILLETVIKSRPPHPPPPLPAERKTVETWCHQSWDIFSC
jgi:hypothetical protein